MNNTAIENTATRSTASRNTAASRIVLLVLVAIALLAGACTGESDPGASTEPEVPLTLVESSLTGGPVFELMTDLTTAVCQDDAWPTNLHVTATGPQQIVTATKTVQPFYLQSTTLGYPHSAYSHRPLAADYVACITMTDTDAGLGSGYCSSDRGSHLMITNMYSVQVRDLQQQTVTELGEVPATEFCPSRILYFDDEDGSPTYFYGKPSADALKTLLADYMVDRNNPSPDALTLDELLGVGLPPRSAAG